MNGTTTQGSGWHPDASSLPTQGRAGDANLQDVQADVAMLVHVRVVTRRHELHRWRDVGVAAGETQGQFVFESVVSLNEQRG